MTQTLWLNNFQQSLEDAGMIPLWGLPPAFPWEEVQNSLSALLQVEKLTLSIDTTEWLEPDQFLSSYGEKPFILPLSLSPLTSPLFWVTSLEDLEKITTIALSSTQKKSLSDPHYQTGFYRYFMAEVAHVLNENNAFGDLKVQMAEPAVLPIDSALCLDISLKIGRKKSGGRLICPRDFHRSFASFFRERKESLLTSPLAKTIEPSLGVRIGSTELTPASWLDVKKGDFMLLDSCSFEPSSQKGKAELVFENHPLFNIACEEGKITILEPIQIYKETVMTDLPEEPPRRPMPKEPTPKEENPMEPEPTAKEEPLMAEETPMEKTALLDEPITSPEQIPLNVNVELTRIRMPLEKLLSLQPGNVIELEAASEQGVDLTINGKKVARGELIRIGETLGVKILKIHAS